MGVPCHLPPTAAELVSLIHVSAHRGDGSASNPERVIHLYYAQDGRLLACHDPLNGPADGFMLAQQKEGA
ncbi:hypothetical protein [Burkholderia ubonensis]|uniref:hypothetical protein n=1 Tax=Burkholderia ubonensis TaxID=101571 RepID=UPI000A4B061F|nr:hypothetical protein [Burkholderia ubonensis]